MRQKLNRFDLLEMKKTGNKITWITAYDYPTAYLAEKAGIDMILVGDSLGMCIYGYEGTIPVTMDQMIYHSEAVRRAAPNTFVIGDMPFLSYQTTIEEAVKNAGRFLKEARVDAVKLEGGLRVCPQIGAIADAGMLVMGHIGLTPQSSGQLGGFKAQGRMADSAYGLVGDTKAIEKSGAFALLVEAVPPEVTRIIRQELTIPVYGIGAGDADGQLLIVDDLLGNFQAFTPKFVKKYADISSIKIEAFKQYISDVKEGNFPTEEHTYKMIEGETEKLANKVRKVYDNLV